MKTKHENNLSLLNAVIIGSIAYFIMFVAAIYSNFIVRGKLILGYNLQDYTYIILNSILPMQETTVSNFCIPYYRDFLL